MIHPAIRKISQLPEDNTVIGEGLTGERIKVFNVAIKDEFIDTVEPSDIVFDERLPAYLSPYTSRNGSLYDALCVMRSVSVIRSESSKTVFTIRYQYSTASRTPGTSNLEPLGALPPPPGSPNPAGATNDPLALAPKFQLHYEQIVLPFRRTLDNPPVPVLNTAKEFFDPTPTVEGVFRVIPYTRYESVWRPSFWSIFAFVVNKDPWNGYPAKHVLSYPPVAQQWQAIGNGIYFPVEYQFKLIDTSIYPDWDLYIDNFGRFELEDLGGGNFKRKPISRGGQSPVSVPWPLDANGAALTEAQVRAGTLPHRSKFKRYLAANFDLLNITLPAEGTDFKNLPG